MAGNFAHPCTSKTLLSKEATGVEHFPQCISNPNPAGSLEEYLNQFTAAPGKLERVHAEGRTADFSPGPKPMQGSASPIVIQATPAFRKSHNRQTNASSKLHLNPLSRSKPMSMYVFPQSMAQSSPKRLMTRVMFVWSHPKLSLSLQQRVEWFQTIGCVSI